ncbi:MAG: DUF4465 domain-containing protein [Chitinophagales bacterium]|nr:DUF4465 domain-containing protein [Chitinophagales bacterium]
MKKFTLSVFTLLVSSFLFAQTVSTFESLSLAPDSYWNGSDLSGGFSNGNAFFANDYDLTFFSWSGFSYSNMKDSTTAGWSNQYSAIAASGYNGSANYAVADEYGNAKVILTGNAAGKYVEGFYVTNATYAYLSMRDGDVFSKKFGGNTGTDEDWFKLTVKGWLNGNLKNNEVEFYLADFRFADSTEDYIVRDWRWVNLQPLGNVDSIQFFLTSSDTGQWGMNTPAYFCIDNFTTADVANVAPIAVNDFVAVKYDTDTLIAVLANDFDTTAVPLKVTITAGPLIPGATTTVDANNNILYTPAIGVVATDTLDYKVCDGEGLCASARVIINVQSPTGIEDVSAFAVSVFPNPFTSVLNIRLTHPAQSVQLFDINGRIVMEQTAGDNVVSFHTQELASGTYFLKVITAQSSFTKRIVKQ